MAGFLVGLLATFLFVRINTRLIRAKVSWWFHDIESEGGTHVHHMVIGVVLMATVGILLIALAPAGLLAQVLALAFGAGVALTLDEFALILRLQDVYWREEGRLSVDAVIIVVCVAGLFVLGLDPFAGLGDTSAGGDVARAAVGSLRPRRPRAGRHLSAQGQDLDRRDRPVRPLPRHRRLDPPGASELAVGAPQVPDAAQEAGEGREARGSARRAHHRLARRVLRPDRRQAAPAVAAAGRRRAGAGGRGWARSLGRPTRRPRRRRRRRRQAAARRGGDGAAAEDEARRRRPRRPPGRRGTGAAPARSPPAPP